MGRQIYPDLDFWGIAEPFLDNWLLEQFNPAKIKDFIIENKEDLLIKASEMPSMAFDALDELSSFAKYRNESDKKLKLMELQLQKEKLIIRSIGVVIMLGAILIILSK